MADVLVTTYNLEAGYKLAESAPRPVEVAKASAGEEVDEEDRAHHCQCRRDVGAPLPVCLPLAVDAEENGTQDFKLLRSTTGRLRTARATHTRSAQRRFVYDENFCFFLPKALAGKVKALNGAPGRETPLSAAPLDNALEDDLLDVLPAQCQHESVPSQCAGIVDIGGDS